MSIIKPKFVFDKTGRIICSSHHRCLEFDLALISEYQEKKLFTCKACNYYKNNLCIYSKKGIRKILIGLRFGRYSCELCGGKLSRMFAVLYKKVIQTSRPNEEIMAFCDSCASGFTEEELVKILKQNKKGHLYSGISMAIISISSVLLPYFLIPSLFFIISLLAIYPGFFSFLSFYSVIKLSRSINDSPLIQKVIEKRIKYVKKLKEKSDKKKHTE